MARPDPRGRRPVRSRPGYVEREQGGGAGRWAGVAVAVTIVVVAVAFGWRYLADGGLPGIGGSEPVSGGVLRFAVGEPAGLEPRMALDADSRQIVQLIFDGLTALDPVTDEVVPAAAESWSSEESATVWRFKLRQGAEFQNGVPVTAVDFKFAWERLVDPKLYGGSEPPLAYMFRQFEGFDELQAGKASELSGVRVIDDLTLEVELRESFADLPALVAHPALSPVPRATLMKDAAAYAKRPIGNGPFSLADPWRKGGGARLTRNDKYYGRAAYLDGVDLVVYQDDGAAWRALQTDKVDFCPVPVSGVEQAEERFKLSADGLVTDRKGRFLTGGECATFYLACNLKDPLIAKPQVRKALSLALDRSAIAESVYGGTRSPADGIVSPGVPGYRKGLWPNSKYDLEAAKKALGQAGYPGGNGMPEVKLSYNTGVENEKAAKAIRTQWAAIGVRTKLVASEYSEHLDSVEQGDFQIARLAIRPDLPTLDAFLSALFTSTSADNVTHYSNTGVDQALATGRSITDVERRLGEYRAADKQVASDLPVIPVLFYGHRHAVSERVAHLGLSPVGYAALDEAWLVKGGK